MDLKIHFSDPSEKHRDTQGVRKWVGAREEGIRSQGEARG